MSDTSYANNTLTAFFDDRSDAQEAADRLKALGISETSIRLVGDESLTTDATTDRADTDKGFWESLGDFFFPDEDRATYAEGLRRGGTLLTVSSIPSGLYDEALDILDDEGTVDIDSRSESWRSEGWTGTEYGTGVSSGTTAATTGAGLSASRSFDDAGPNAVTSTEATLAADAENGSSPAYASSERTGLDATLQRHGGTEFGTDQTTSVRGDRDEDIIPVVEEQLRVGKRDVNLGRVRVRSYVVQEPVSEAVNLREERVSIERRPVDRELSGTEAAFTDRVIEAEEHAEEAVVSKEARVKEEIALRREAGERTETVSDTVRHTEVEVEDDRADRVAEERTRVNKPFGN